jgi:hypothetical protein
MPSSIHPQPTSTLDQLDRQLRETPRQHAQILDLDAFRRDLERPSDQPTASTALPTDTETADAETELRDELNLAFIDLGAAAFALAHHGTFTDRRLAAHVQRIHQLYAQPDASAHTAPIMAWDHGIIGLA